MPVIKTNEQGEQTNEKDETKTTHIAPDLMLPRYNEKGEFVGNYIVDYKSSHEGAYESLVQSAFYDSMMRKGAQTYFAETAKNRQGKHLISR